VTPEQMRAAHPMLSERVRVRVRTMYTMRRVMGLLLMPLSVLCAAVAGAHSEHKLMREAQPAHWDDNQRRTAGLAETEERTVTAGETAPDNFGRDWGWKRWNGFC
jgi:hypothetical protein